MLDYVLVRDESHVAAKKRLLIGYKAGLRAYQSSMCLALLPFFGLHYRLILVNMSHIITRAPFTDLRLWWRAITQIIPL